MLNVKSLTWLNDQKQRSIIGKFCIHAHFQHYEKNKPQNDYEPFPLGALLERWKWAWLEMFWVIIKLLSFFREAFLNAPYKSTFASAVTCFIYSSCHRRPLSVAVHTERTRTSATLLIVASKQKQNKIHTHFLANLQYF